MPSPPHGWHRPNRRAASHPPRQAPCTSSASNAYDEHVGQYRHGDGRPARTA